MVWTLIHNEPNVSLDWQKCYWIQYSWYWTEVWIVYSLWIGFLKLHDISASQLEVLVMWYFPSRNVVKFQKHDPKWVNNSDFNTNVSCFFVSSGSSQTFVIRRIWVAKYRRGCGFDRIGLHSFQTENAKHFILFIFAQQNMEICLEVEERVSLYNPEHNSLNKRNNAIKVENE